MGFGDPDHRHPLDRVYLKKEADCFRCKLPIILGATGGCFGCTRCNHFVHPLCFGLPQNMTHPLHPQHSLTLSPSPISSSSQITENCSQCLEPFFGGYAYHCQSCPKFNLHLKCFLTLNLETKHHHPLSLCERYYDKDCCICGHLIDHSYSYCFSCESSGDCNISIHFECISLPPKVKHHHVHELTFEYNYPKRSKIVDCDVCLNGEELDRTLSYYYCERCDYIAHVRCVVSQPPKVTIQFDHFIHEHPMLFLRFPEYPGLTCAACRDWESYESFYFCTICNYALHKSCARFPRSIKHPHHEEDHTLSLQSRASQNKVKVCCGFCTKELEGESWIFQCSDCEFVVHLYCARQFKHPLYDVKSLDFTSNGETKFRCNACGELGDGFRMSENLSDLHLECFALPGQIESGCHSHPLYLVTSPTEIESYRSLWWFQCDICHTEADPYIWVYCCTQCKYIAHLKCVVSHLLPVPGRSSDLTNLCSVAICEKEKFRVWTKLDDCTKLLENSPYNPVFLPDSFFFNLKPVIGDQNGPSITLDATDSDKSFTDVLCCPKCEKPISAQAYSSVWDWVHRNLKASIYKMQIQTPADNESLALLDEKVVDELYCPICNLSIFPPTYSCADCEIFFHKSCAELPRKYTADAGHTLVLQSPSLNSRSFSNCSQCKHPCKGYAYFCTSCNIGFDVTCALGAPLLKLENQRHSCFATYSKRLVNNLPKCRACRRCVTEGDIYFNCGSSCCGFNIHLECALLSRVVKHRIHQHPLVLEPYLDLSVDDYICDVCEKELNPCVWVYRCSDICGDRATSHVSCIVTSNKKCHFVYDEECSYPHLNESEEFRKEYGLPPKKNIYGVYEDLVSLVDKLEHEYVSSVANELIEMDEVEVLHLMESPDALRAKVAEIMKDLTPDLPNTDEEENAADDEDH